MCVSEPLYQLQGAELSKSDFSREGTHSSPFPTHRSHPVMTFWISMCYNPSGNPELVHTTLGRGQLLLHTLAALGKSRFPSAMPFGNYGISSGPTRLSPWQSLQRPNFTCTCALGLLLKWGPLTLL